MLNRALRALHLQRLHLDRLAVGLPGYVREDDLLLAKLSTQPGRGRYRKKIGVEPPQPSIEASAPSLAG